MCCKLLEFMRWLWRVEANRRVLVKWSSACRVSMTWIARNKKYREKISKNLDLIGLGKAGGLPHCSFGLRCNA